MAAKKKSVVPEIAMKLEAMWNEGKKEWAVRYPLRVFMTRRDIHRLVTGTHNYSAKLKSAGLNATNDIAEDYRMTATNIDSALKFRDQEFMLITKAEYDQLTAAQGSVYDPLRDYAQKWPDSAKPIYEGLPISWESLKPSPLHILLSHSDCDGEISPTDCAAIADELEKLLPELTDEVGGHIDSYRKVTERLDLLNRAERESQLAILLANELAKHDSGEFHSSLTLNTETNEWSRK